MTPIGVGDWAELSRTISSEDVKAFAQLTGDDNPVHLDEAFASGTRFGRCIAHGMWSGALISAVIGTRLPGPGTIYLEQVVQFLAPVFPGDAVTARVEVIELGPKSRVSLQTTCRNQDGVEVVRGRAVVIAPQRDG